MKALFGIPLAAAAVLASLAGAPVAEARELRTASGTPPAHPANSHLYQRFADYIVEESGGSLTARHMGPEVVTLGQMKDALQTQLLDIGNLLPFYFPAELPNLAMAGELALTGRNPHAMGAAMTEYIVTCESCLDEMRRFGIVYLGSGSSDVYTILSNRPVSSLADLQGLRLRSGGAPFSRWAEHVDAVPVAVSVNDIFEAVSQGTVDGSMASVADMLSFRLIELLEYVSVFQLGTYHATSNFTVADSTWQSLSAEERTAVAAAANRANADFTQRWGVDMPAEAREAANAAGVTFVEVEADLIEATEAFTQADIATAAELSRDRFGLDDAEARIDRFLALVDKWTAIVEDTGNDPVAIAERTQQEIWSQVDFSSYGL